MAMPSSQDKQREIAFFDGHATADTYDAFTPAANDRLIDAFVALSGLPPASRVVDLGCGSGVFTDVLQRRGYRCCGVDLSPKLIGSRVPSFAMSNSSRVTPNSFRGREL